MDDGLLDKMRERAQKCRRLADALIDSRAARELRDMASEIEADIKRMEAEQRPASGAAPQAD
jgi:hypothetical protein